MGELEHDNSGYEEETRSIHLPELSSNIVLDRKIPGKEGLTAFGARQFVNPCLYKWLKIFVKFIQPGEDRLLVSSFVLFLSVSFRIRWDGEDDLKRFAGCHRTTEGQCIYCI